MGIRTGTALMTEPLNLLHSTRLSGIAIEFVYYHHPGWHGLLGMWYKCDVAGDPNTETCQSVDYFVVAFCHFTGKDHERRRS